MEVACAPQLPTVSTAPWGLPGPEARGLMTLRAWHLEFVTTGLGEYTLGAFILFFKRFYLFISRERGREKDRERNIDV